MIPIEQIEKEYVERFVNSTANPSRDSNIIAFFRTHLEERDKRIAGFEAEADHMEEAHKQIVDLQAKLEEVEKVITDYKTRIIPAWKKDEQDHWNESATLRAKFTEAEKRLEKAEGTLVNCMVRLNHVHAHDKTSASVISSCKQVLTEIRARRK